MSEFKNTTRSGIAENLHEHFPIRVFQYRVIWSLLKVVSLVGHAWMYVKQMLNAEKTSANMAKIKAAHRKPPTGAPVFSDVPEQKLRRKNLTKQMIL